MKKLIAYSSKTGSTKKVAEKLKEYDPKADLLEIKSNIKFEDYDFIYVLGWIDKGTYNQATLDFISKIKNKPVAFLFTLGAYPNSVHAYDCINKIKEEFDSSNDIIAHWHCQGPIDPNLVDWMKKLEPDHSHAPDQARILRWEDAKKHPNEEDYHSLLSFENYTRKKFILND